MRVLQWSLAGLMLTLLAVGCKERSEGTGPVQGVKVTRWPEKTLDLGNLGSKITMKLVLIPAGKFVMGSQSTEVGHEDKESPMREVTLSKPFYMGVYEVTQEQYEVIMGKAPSHSKGAKLPVDSVSWNDTQEFCKKLSQKTGKTCRLATEAEWEYACRAGSSTPWFFGTDPQQLSYYAWWEGNASSMTHASGEKKPNGWGLYNMTGNVWEWVQDHDSGSYDINSVIDPTGNATATGVRVYRGGSYESKPEDCRSAKRRGAGEGIALNDVGFRVVMEK